VLRGSDAVNADVLGHIGPRPGNDSSIAWTCTSITGGTVVLVFCENIRVGHVVATIAHTAQTRADL
jgi:hypothetical protein